ncbi:WD repeat-containing protein 62 isoform X2 [Sardina pilchardus]|uniref:WD repeat-containing protein 62 isoform X2 n=1 Tax=Sardina pilchardus TaxID=27697 RepID=UPI002E124B4D
MAETSQFGGGSFTCTVKKANSNNATSSNVTHLRRKTRQSHRRNIHNRVVLEKVLGITTSSSSGLACDPNTGLVAYPAGCVVVILHPKKNKQSHILNTSRKTFSALAFSQDGKYLVTGESGHMPCVRVWDVAERAQVAEVQCHKYGVACVAFSANGSYIVSVGYQHDQTVNVWEWRKGTVIASNKVSSRVLSVSFSEDNSYFVTAGNRHVKFWYLDASKERRVNSTVPLIGRSGLLGEQRNSTFCGLTCGRGAMAGSAYCITHTGLLCLFNSKRQLEAWVDLKTSSARCLSVSENYVFCGCADGMVRVFRPQDLHFITTLHRPHRLGVDISQGVQPGHLFTTDPSAEYPDTLALTYDPVARHLTCVYNDHSVYVWDVRDIKNVGKVYSALYHSGTVWSVETYPEVEGPHAACLPPSSFLTCSSDNTIRLWHLDPQQGSTQTQAPAPGLPTSLHRNLYSQDLMRIVYVGEDTQHLQSEGERGEGGSLDGKSGIRVLGVSPDGQHLAAGDRNGSLRIFELQFLDEIAKIVAHDSEVLCLEFSPTDTGLRLLASASRDRLIHIFNVENNYNLEQTVYDHSASITAIKFSGDSSDVNMVSCGADKSIYFRTAEQTAEGLSFSRSHYVAEKTTLYDMDLDATGGQAAIACQDRNVRVYNIKTGKMMRCFKGSLSEEGTLLKVQMDPSGVYLATSCSDKNISIFDYESGECVASLFGHSEIVTGMRFSQDCRHLITVSGDSCVFLWRLDSQMTNSMRKRLAEKRERAGVRDARAASQQHVLRRETYITVPAMEVAQEKAEEEEDTALCEEEPRTPARLDTTPEVADPMLLQTNGRLPMWARKLAAVSSAGAPGAQGPAAAAPTTTTTAAPSALGPYQPRGRWAEQSDPQAIRSLLETRSLQLALTPSPQRGDGGGDAEEEADDAHFHPQSLDSLMDEEEEEEEEEPEDEDEKSSSGHFEAGFPRPGYLPLPAAGDLFGPGRGSLDRNDYILYPANSTALSTGGDGDFDVKALCEVGEELSPDSACCVGSAESRGSNQEPAMDHTDSLSQVSSTGSSGVEEEEEEEPETLLRQHFDTLANSLSGDAEKFDTDPRSLQPASDSNFLNPRLSISTRFLSRFQNRLRGVGCGASAARPAALPPSISEEASPGSSPTPPTASSAPSAPTQPIPQGSTKTQQAGEGAVEPPTLAEEAKSRAEAVRLVKSRPPMPRKQHSAHNLRRPRPLHSRHSIAAIGCNSTLGEVTDKALFSQSNIENVATTPGQNPVSGPSPKPGHPAPEKDAAGLRSSQSYMSATTSSRAKVSRSGTPGEAPARTPLTEEATPPAKASGPRAPSLQDLSSEHGDFKENLPPTSLPPPLASSLTNAAFTSETGSASLPSTPMASTGTSSSSGQLPGNHSARAALRLDLSGSDCCPSPGRSTPAAAMKSRRRLAPEGAPRQGALVTPTEMRSLGQEGRKRISSIEDGMTPRGALGSRASAALTSPACCRSPEPSQARGAEGHPRSDPQAQLQQQAVSQSSAPAASPAVGNLSFQESPASCSSPLDSADSMESVNLQTCNQIVNELRHTMKRAVSLYSKLCSHAELPDQQAQMVSVLQDAFAGVRSELDMVFTPSSPPLPPLPEDSPGRQLRDQRAVALLERYSELLLQMAEKKMDTN